MISEVDVNTLSWTGLNDLLLDCDDMSQLRRWLDATAGDGVLSRAIRVYGRFSNVRRAGELKELKAKVTEAQKKRRMV